MKEEPAWAVLRRHKQSECLWPGGVKVGGQLPVQAQEAEEGRTMSVVEGSTIMAVCGELCFCSGGLEAAPSLRRHGVL